MLGAALDVDGAAADPVIAVAAVGLQLPAPFCPPNPLKPPQQIERIIAEKNGSEKRPGPVLTFRNQQVGGNGWKSSERPETWVECGGEGGSQTF